jgi:hypothetical protein
MSNPNRNFMLTAAWRVTPAADRWQAYQARLSRGMHPGPHPWTRRSAVLCDWRALPARASAAGN